ncbi:MAG: acetyl-CoA C-acetyltransferase [Ghiorsea sp.]|nr:acetyl-CoA C-acetyltransferase [Ghiorsea sp.]
MSKCKVYVVDGLRTPFLKARGKRGAFSASDLAVYAGRSLLMRQPFKPSDFDEVIMGCVMPEPDEMNIARIIALRLGCGKEVPAWTVQRNCASGIQSIDAARLKIQAGESDLILAGGTEVMSRAPLLLSHGLTDWLGDFQRCKTLPQKLSALTKLRPAYLAPIVGILKGLSDPVVGLSMGQTAENLAYRFQIGREDMDAFAVKSHIKVVQAMEAGVLQDEIVQLIDKQGNIYDHDDGVRPESSIENLAKLRPVFDRKYGMVTAGNSAQITDGAAMLILASSKAVRQYNLPVLGTVDDVSWAGLAPEEMGLGPAFSIPPLLTKHKLSVDDIDAWEINEAFSVQVLASLQEMKNTGVGDISLDKINREGGAIAIGHPVGASGARIVLHLLHSMKRNGEKRGIASLCIGGGQGGAVLLSGGES